jgi:CDP-glucose 4,6-dehydratase
VGIALIEEINQWYRGKRVFVTGHTGFKGSWLSSWLSAAGAHVTGYALAPDADRRSLYREANLDSQVESVIADICDRRSLDASIEKAQPDVVFHLAAQSLVRESYARPVETYQTNVLGTVTLLDALRRYRGVKAVVIVTSDKCYDNQGANHAYVEDDAMGGSDPYSSSKGCAEIATAAFRESFFAGTSTSVATARAGNVIGGGDWADDRLVPDIMRAAEAGSAAIIRNPDFVRPWQFVLEPLRGYLMLGQALSLRGNDFASAWNFGPRKEDGLRVGELADRVANALGNVTVRNERQIDAAAEAAFLQIDSTRAADLLGWRPVITLDRAIELTVKSYKSFHAGHATVSSMNETLSAYWKDVDAAR